MSTLRKIYSGMNGKVQKPFVDADGAPLNLGAAISITAEVYQNERLIDSFTLADDPEVELIDIDGTNDGVEYEYTTAFSATLKKYITYLKLIVIFPDSANNLVDIDSNVNIQVMDAIFEVV